MAVFPRQPLVWNVLTDALTEVPLAETCRCVWHDRVVFMDGNQFDHQLRLLKRRPDNPHLGNVTGRLGNARDCSIAGRIGFNVGRAKHYC